MIKRFFYSNTDNLKLFIGSWCFIRVICIQNTSVKVNKKTDIQMIVCKIKNFILNRIILIWIIVDFFEPTYLFKKDFITLDKGVYTIYDPFFAL